MRDKPLHGKGTNKGILSRLKKFRDEKSAERALTAQQKNTRLNNFRPDERVVGEDQLYFHYTIIMDNED